jgi:malate dehydrogenase (oxaloacetate-decarboxylating)
LSGHQNHWESPVRSTRPFPLRTNNHSKLNDPEYLGWRHERVTGQEYLDFVDRFVQAVKKELPQTCLQWEDFATPHARPLLVRYQDQLLSFNDDVQGTAAVVLGAIVGASKVAGKSIKEHQIVFVGAGSAAIGVADYLRAAMVEEGLSEQEARARFWIVDKDGLLDSDRRDLSDEQKIYARLPAEISNWSRDQKGQIGLVEVIGNVDATALIGLSTVKRNLQRTDCSGNGQKSRSTNYLSAIKPNQPFRSGTFRPHRPDGRSSSGRDRIAFCAG